MQAHVLTILNVCQCLLKDGGVLKCSGGNLCSRRVQGHAYRAALHQTTASYHAVLIPQTLRGHDQSNVILSFAGFSDYG